MAMQGSVQQHNSGSRREGLLIGGEITWLCQKGKKKKVLCQIMLLLKINPRISTHDSLILFGRVFKIMILLLCPLLIWLSTSISSGGL